MERLARCGHSVPSHPGRARLHCKACAPVAEARLCARCGANIDHLKGDAKYCGATCRARAQDARKIADGRYAAELAALKESRARVWATLTCTVCGGPIPGARMANAKFCSKRCSSADTRRREAEGHYGTCSESGCDRPRRAKGLCGTHYNRTYHPDSDKTASPAVRRAALHRKNVRRRMATRSAEAEVFDHREIFERDQWRCGICRRHVDRRLVHPHPRSASLDHIIPLSEHGPHTRANVRLAHLDCNVSRSNKGGGEQLALIG